MIERQFTVEQVGAASLPAVVLTAIFMVVQGGGTPTPTPSPSGGQFDFSSAGQSGFIALLFEDF